MKLLVSIVFFGLVSTSLGIPEASVTVRQRRDVDFLANTRQLVQQLIENLLKAVQQARDAIATFIQGIQQQIQLFRQKIIADIQKLRDGIEQAIKNILDRITSVGPAMKECIENQRDAAEHLFAAARENSYICADQNVDEIQAMVDKLSVLADGAVNYTRTVVEQMDGCSKNSSSLFNKGACLGSLVVKTEYNGITFATQSTIMISKINLSLLTFPAALEVCAGKSLLSASSEAKTILSEIASCSRTSIFPSSVSDELSL